MDIGSVLSRAWQTIWKHKVLWIFGILAGCTNASPGSSNFRNTYQGQLPPEAQRFFNQFSQLPNWQISLIVALLILAILLIIIVVIFLGTIGKIGLIRGASDVDRGAASLSFGDLFGESMRYFWRVFGLNLLVGLAAFVIAILVGILVVFGSIVTLGIGAICLVPLLCLLVPLGWLVSIIVEQASIAIVLENLGITAGLRRGWNLVRNNLGAIIVMAIILLLGGLLVGLIIGLPVVLIVIPAVLGVASGAPRAAGGGLLVAGLCFVAYLPVLLVLNGILRGYIESAWTLTFLDLSRRSTLQESTPTAIL